MRYTAALLFVFLFAAAASAQEYVIKLNAKEDTVEKNRNFYFVSVEDNREDAKDRRTVGHFGRNDKTKAVLEKDIDPFFLEYLQAVYPQRQGDFGLMLRINKIICSSTGGMLSEAKVELDIDIVSTATGEVISNITLTKTRQPLMGGKTFGTLIEEIIAYAVSMIKLQKPAEH